MVVKIEIPDITEFKEVIVRLDTPRIVTYKDNRKINPKITTLIPKELENYNCKEGIYFFMEGDKPIYIGQTENLNNRMRVHSFLKSNPTIKSLLFLELKDHKLRRLYEVLYKYSYMGIIDFEDEHYEG